MARQTNSNLSRAISVADYILEGNGHSIAEASKEFHLGKTTIERDINLLGSVAFYSYHPNAKNLQVKYVKVRKTLAKVTKDHHVNNFEKWNAKNAKKATS